VGDTYLVEIEVAGPHMDVYLDGILAFSADDGTHEAGTVGFQSDANDGSFFDDVRVVEPPCGEPEVLLTEGFAGETLDGWSVLDVGTNQGPSAWSVSGGWATQTTNIWGHPSGGDSGGTFLVYDSGFGWSNYRYRLRLRSSDDDGIGVLFRYQGTDDYYAFYLHSQLSQRRLFRRAGGQETLLAGDSFAYRVSDDYVVEIGVRGDRIDVYLDSVLVFSAEDDALATGTVGFLSRANDGSRFDDVRVVLEESPP
jgi:hypothetical protein